MPLTLSSQLQEIFTYGSVGNQFTQAKKFVPQHIYNSFDPEVSESAFKLVDPNAWVGIEIEVEGIHKVPDAMKTNEFPGLAFWDTVTDHSLKDAGREFVSCPIKGPAIPLALHHLQKFLKKYNSNHKFSVRCGTHIHVGCRYMTLEQIVRFLLLYLVVENVVFDQAGEKRKHSNFCVPLGDAVAALEFPKLFYYLDTKQYDKIVGVLVGEWKKYAALNTLPLEGKGTIEFRHYGGTIDVAFILKQINMIMSLRKFAIKNSTETVTQFIKDLNTTSGYNHFVDHVLALDDDYTPQKLQELMEDRVRQAKEMLAYVSVLKHNANKYQDSDLLKVTGVTVEHKPSKLEQIMKQLEENIDDESVPSLQVFSSLTENLPKGIALNKELSFP